MPSADGGGGGRKSFLPMECKGLYGNVKTPKDKESLEPRPLLLFPHGTEKSVKLDPSRHALMPHPCVVG